MANLQQFSARICQTAAAFIIHENKVLLVNHKKLGFWLAPGGHLDPGELPHQAAERECFEETGIRVQAVDAYRSLDSKQYDSQNAQYLPAPFAVSLHWVSEANYQARIQDPTHYQPLSPWTKGCEQHLGFCYLVEPAGETTIQPGPGESTEIKWVTLEQLSTLDTTNGIRHEVQRAFACRQALDGRV